MVGVPFRSGPYDARINRGGRPRHSSIDRPLRDYLDKPLGKDHPVWPLIPTNKRRGLKGKTPGEVTALYALSRAMQGDIDWAKWVAERAQGRPPESMQLDVSERHVLMMTDGELVLCIEQLAGRLGMAVPPALLDALRAGDDENRAPDHSGQDGGET